MPNSEPGYEQPKITVLFGPFSANEVSISMFLAEFDVETGAKLFRKV